MSTLYERRERAKRMERWAETAMAMLLKNPLRNPENDSPVTLAWTLAVEMEDRRTYVLRSLKDTEPEEP